MKSSTGNSRFALIDGFMPAADVAERHAVTVNAPAYIVFHVASTFDVQSLPPVRAIFRLRNLFMRASRTAPRLPRGLVAETEALGWQCLAKRERREYVAGAAARPWLADVTFRPIAPELFKSFAARGWVKIAWSLEAEPLSAATTRFVTQTRVLATDDEARRLFRGYWRWAGFGIVAIRWLLVRAVRREAERRWRLTENAARPFLAAGIHSQGSFT